jgi:hypothetical protein
MEKAANKNLERRADDLTSKYSKAYKLDPKVTRSLMIDAPTGKVRVRLPDGRTGMIPREKLEEAIKRGAEEI